MKTKNPKPKPILYFERKKHNILTRRNQNVLQQQQKPNISVGTNAAKKKNMSPTNPNFYYKK